MRFTTTSAFVAMLIAAGAVGCRWHKSRTDCPTDARALMLSCAGEEAVRQCPCGPDAAYYGHRRTTWSVWPAGWESYADAACVENVSPCGGDAPCTTPSGPDGDGTSCLTGEPSAIEQPTPLFTPTPAVVLPTEKGESDGSLETVPAPPSTPLVLPSGRADDASESEFENGEESGSEVDEIEDLPPSTPIELPPVELPPIELPPLEAPPEVLEATPDQAESFPDYAPPPVTLRKLRRVPVSDPPSAQAPPIVFGLQLPGLPAPAEPDEAAPATAQRSTRYMNLFTP